MATDSRWTALDRLTYIVQQDRKTAPTGRWHMVRDYPMVPFLASPTSGGLWRGKPLSDPRIFAEACRYNMRRYRWRQRT